MAENKYVGGIQINTSGFEVKAAAPVDSRFRVKNAEGLLELLTYEGLVSYNEADKKYYGFADGEWKVLSVNTPAELEALIKGLIATETTGAMNFKDATATLPENPVKGDMYKVAGENINIVIDEKSAKAGDTIIYNGEKWVLIPSGDDIEDTWRKIIAGGNELANDEALELIAGENVTITENAGKVTISSSYENTHYESKLIVGNEASDASDENVVENGNVRLNLVEDGVVKSSHKLVGAGGITVTHTKAEGEDGENVITIEAPEGAKYDLTAKTENNEAILSLAGTDNTEDKVAIVGNDAVAVTIEGGKIKFSAHDTKYESSNGEEVKVTVVNDGAITAELTEAVRTKLDKVWEEVGVAAGLVEGLAEGQVKTNKEAIEAINDETNGILAKANAEIAKDRERLVALEAIDHDYAGADATLKAELQKEIDDDVKVVSDYVGTFTDSTAKTVVEYIEERTKGIATEGAMIALNERVTAAEGDIKTIKDDYLKAEDIVDFETKENVQKVADDLAAEVKARDDADKAFETRIGTLESKFGTGEGTVEAQIAAEKARAEEIEGGLRTDVDAIKGDYLKAADRTALQTAINNEKARAEGIEGGLRTDVDAVTGRVTTAEGKITALEEASAKHAEKTYVDTELGKKADKSVVNAMYTNAQIDTAVQGAKDYAKGLVDAIPEAPVYSLKKAADSGAYAAVYNLTRDGEIVGDTINIPKDMVVESGKVVENPAGQTAGTYIELKLQNVTNPLYINVGSLIEYVTSGSKADDAVVVAVDNDHKVTATLTDGKITLAKLEKDVQDAIALAKTALQAADIVGKADKVSDATAGNFAGLDAEGNLTDSGINAEDLWDNQENLANFNGQWAVAENGAMSSTTGGITLGDRAAVYTQLNGTCFKIVSETDMGETTYGYGSISSKNGTFTLPAETGTLLTDKDEKIGALRDSIIPQGINGTIATDGWAFGTNLAIGSVDNRIYLNNTNKTIVLDRGANGQTTYGENKISLWAGSQSGELTLPYKKGTLVVDKDLDAYALKSNYGANESELVLNTPDYANVGIRDGAITFNGGIDTLVITNKSSTGDKNLYIGDNGLGYSFTANGGTNIAYESVAFVDRIKVGTGLKAETITNATDRVQERHISIDEEVVFVLDCN
jgi:hypothetical protein